MPAAPPRGLSSALQARYPVLALRGFRLLLAERFLAPAASGFSLVGVSFAVLQATGSTAALSWVLAVQIAPALLFTLAGGVFADRFAPQRVIVAGNLAMAVGEGTFGLLALTGRPLLWQMMALEALTGGGMAMLYPAGEALLPRLVPADQLAQGKALGRLTMNGAQMAGAAVGGLVVAATGPGTALLLAAGALLLTMPALSRIGRLASPAIGVAGPRDSDPAPGDTDPQPGLIRALREGWGEFRSRTWLWAIVGEYCVVMAAWYGGVQVLGPVAAKARLGGPAAWGVLMGSIAVGLILGGLVALHYAPRRPMRLVALAGAVMGLTPLALAAGLPLPLVCLCAVLSGAADELMMVQWTLALARNVPPAALARVSSFDALGSVSAMPVGALAAGPIATAAGLSATQYGAAALMLAAACAALIPREVRGMQLNRALAASEPAGAVGMLGGTRAETLAGAED
jgi:MFS family permease